ISFLPICILLGIDMQKKWRDRLPCLHSTIPKSFSFSESDRRGVWSVRVGKHYRALGSDEPEGILWFWIDPHSKYDDLIKES
ncbi:hypothetical protein, partial [Roseofilum sp. Belize Diploria]|uniref:ParE family toxin-like protein n=1 Tax=Roseofilum sp. Belize Diploria TaxID=2821501 RepID=UPI001B21FBD8